ncbi:alpha-ketoglutarate-dependent dioxygenase AlkB family protein [Arenimonas sp.]|uniref:alpha-ketoglutarate-dependent dioxygenase AlkB family protein n=1 Tax=Arenimonas sp. TaxID=1872635 RepID=UPI0039E334DD
MLETIGLPGASLRFDPHYLSPAEAKASFAALRGEIPWENHRIRLFGREVASPRLSCWIGDEGTGYRYSGSDFEPRDWTPASSRLREELRDSLALDFNSVLANLYRDGRDGMGWHSDDEPELGDRPVIASLSLGATRRFCLRRRDGTGDVLKLELPPGSLLLMQGDTQENYRHALPKTALAVGERINLTFRRIRRRNGPR